jgi:uncharacterized membrane protein YgaE (UPF0421/DUF939 family)
MRSGRERLVISTRPIVHTSLAAALSWLVAVELFGREQPFFAPIAAVITLGLTVGQRGRRAVELAFGVALGILIADALVLVIGTGTLQIALVTALAMLAARALGGGPLLVSQAAVSAVLVATLQPPTDGFSFERSLDALIGGGVALVVAAVILPVNPVTLIRRTAEPVIVELSATLDDVAAALEARDGELAERSLVRARDMEGLLADLSEAIEAAHESARISIRRRGAQESVREHAESVRNLELAVRNVRVVARGAMRAISLDDHTPPGLIAALRDLAEAVQGIGPALQGGDGEAEEAAESARHAAMNANAALEQTGNMSALHLIGQVRSTAVDLLRALGVDRATAVEDVRTPGS